MTRIFEVNENNDIFTQAGGRLAIAVDVNAVQQLAEHAIKVQIGEMVYDADRGTNMEEVLFSGSPNIISFEASARDALNRIPDVTEVVDFEADLVNNNLEYATTIRTVFGTVQVTSDGSI